MMAKEKKKVPNLRFKGFTNDWEQHKLGTLFQKNIERNDNEKFNYNQTLSVSTMTFKPTGNGASAKSLANYKVLRLGDVAFEGHSNKQFSYGRFVVNDNADGIMSPRFATIRPIKAININYWKNYLHNENIMKYVLVKSTKAGTMMNELVYSDLYKQVLKVPNITEQVKIGNLLQKIEIIITLQQRKLDLLKQLKKGLLQKMFAEKNSKQPVLRFKGFHDDWEQRKLKDVVEKQIKGKAQFEKLAPGEVEYLDTSRLNGGQAILTNGLKDVTLDDILILWDGSKAGTVYHGFEGALGSTLKAYRTSANSKFVYQYLKRHQDNIYNNYRTPNIPHVQKDFLNVFTISVPVSDEQEKIGSFFQQLDNTIVLQHQKIAKYQSIKKSLLQQMFI